MANTRNINVNITDRSILQAIAWTVATILLFHFVGRVSHALTLIFISFFLALALNPAVSWISRHLKSRSRLLASATAYLMVVVILAGFFAITIPPLIRQTRSFINDAPTVVAQFQNQNSSISRLAERYNVDTQLSRAAKDAATHFGGVGTPLLNTGKRVASTFVSILAVVVMTFMMLVEGPQWLSRFWTTVPKHKRANYQKTARLMYRTVTGFVNGQVILAVLAGTCSLIALFVSSNVLDISINVVALAGIVALFGLIPMIGNPVSTTIVVLVCLLSSVNLAAVMLIYFLVYYQIENITLQPYIQSRQNELSPLIVFIAAILGIGLGGILGALVAIPVAGCIRILVEDHFADRELKESEISAIA